MTARERVLRLVEALPESELPTAERVLEALTVASDPVARALTNAPEDDEPLSAAEIAAIEEGEADVRAGRVRSLEDVKRDRSH